MLLANQVETLRKPKENNKIKDILEKRTLVEEVAQSKPEKVKEPIVQLNCNDDKFSSNDDKAILQGDSLNILEYECVVCKKKVKSENNLKTYDLR